MSARNTLAAKQDRRNSRAIRKGCVARKIDLIAWMKLRSNLTTTQCAAVAMAGALKVDSHILGRKTDALGRTTFERYVPVTEAMGPCGKNIRVEYNPDTLKDELERLVSKEAV